MLKSIDLAKMSPRSKVSLCAKESLRTLVSLRTKVTLSFSDTYLKYQVIINIVKLQFICVTYTAVMYEATRRQNQLLKFNIIIHKDNKISLIQL